MFFQILFAFLLSCILSIIWAVASFLISAKHHRPRHTWSGYDLYGMFYIFPVAVILFFLAIGIIIFVSGTAQFFAIIPVGLLLVATTSLFQSIQNN